jgi:hypothetical protein
MIADIIVKPHFPDIPLGEFIRLRSSNYAGTRRMGSILPCCLPCVKAGGLQILCCQGFEVNDYNFTFDALALKPSGFCNVRAKKTISIKTA